MCNAQLLESSLISTNMTQLLLLLLSYIGYPSDNALILRSIVLVYKALHQQAPSYITEMIELRPYSRCLRSSASTDPVLLERRTSHVTFADKSFSCYGLKIWNHLPVHVRNAGSVHIFKKLVKSHLFNEAYKQ